MLLYRSLAKSALVAALCVFAAAQQPAEKKDKDKNKNEDKSSTPITVVPSTGETDADKITTLNPKEAEEAAKAAAAMVAAERDIMASAKPLREPTRMALIRGLNAEFIYLRRTFPITKDGLTLKHGVLKPEGAELRKMIAEHGAAGRPGDKGQISDVQFKGNSVIFELNGGGKKKVHWYQRIQVGGAGGMTPIAEQPDGSMPHGSILTLEFDKFVPDVTVDQMKQLLMPVFDFSSRTALKSYTDTLPPKVKQAIESHEVLVGMNHEMVTVAKGRPQNRIRERDENNNEFEEWVYGTPPQQVDFIRFVKDEVVQVKTMTVDGKRLVKTEKEVDVAAILHPPIPVEPTDAQPAADTGSDPNKTAANKKPSLRRPGEAAPDPGVAAAPADPAHPRDPKTRPGQPVPDDAPGAPPRPPL